MKTIKKAKAKIQGFSIIELMVAVAVIGIIGTIAMPTYKNYAARARQSEAKSALVAIYAAEKSVKAEYGYFTGCLAAIGFTPEGTRRYYSLGFVPGFRGFDLDPYKAFGPVCNSDPSGNLPGQTNFSATMPPAISAKTNPGHIPSDSGIDGAHLLAYAVGNVGNGTAGNSKDYWSIDHNKNLMVSSSIGTTAILGAAAGATVCNWADDPSCCNNAWCASGW